MPHKDPVKRKEYQDEYNRKWRKQKGMIPHSSHYDFETHRELAMNSGIQSKREWKECYKMGLFPDGIYQDPAKHNAFGAK